MRGHNMDEVDMDEYEYVKKQTMDACRPQAEMTGHYMIALSTPTGIDFSSYYQV